MTAPAPSPGARSRRPDFLSSQFERGDLVWVTGRVERFRDELQVEIATIRTAEEGAADPADFLPVAYRDLDELDGFLEHLAREVYDRDYRALLDAFLGDEGFRDELRLAPCTRGGHHAYLGGLLEHTVAVATLAHEACTLHPRLNSDLLLICAALLHDIGKTREFNLGAEIALSDEARCRPPAIGQQLLADRAAKLDDFPQEKLPGALALHPRPPRAGCPARQALPLGRGARAPPPQLDRRRGEGRAGARPARLLRLASRHGARRRDPPHRRVLEQVTDAALS